MKISEVGESRVRGYLFVLERSLRTFLPKEVVADAAREVESHIRERLDQIVQIAPPPDERAVVERVLRELGPPLRVAQAYSLEMTVDEAVATGRVTPMARAFLHVATTTLGGFLAAVMVLWGYLAAGILFFTAVIDPFLPRNVVFTFQYIIPIIRFSYPEIPPGVDQGGYWVIPFALACGFGILVATHRGARGWLTWWIDRRRMMQLRLIDVAPDEDAAEMR
jgi:hypothetical protein